MAVALVAAACSGSDAAPVTTEVATTSPPSTAPSTSVSPSITSSSLPAQLAGSVEDLTLSIDGVDRSYVLYTPPAAPAEPRPLVIDLHGFGSDPESHNDMSQMRQLADVAGFVVAQPQARGDIPTWNGQPATDGSAQDVAFIRAIVEDVATRTPLDEQAVFASGFSNGGGMAHRLACDAADVFAAVGVVAGQYPLVESCSPSDPVAVMAFHGTDDLVVPIGGLQRVFPDVAGLIERWAQRNECAPVPARARVAPDVVVDTWSACDDGAEVVFYIIEDGGHAWPGSPQESFFETTREVDATQTLWAFFVTHRRS